jgi:predicted HTH domain antitoxin
MQTVNVRQLKTNPSVALREAKNDLVVVMNRDQPAAVLVSMEQLGGSINIKQVRLAMAVTLFKQRSLSIGAAAKFAGEPLGTMLSIVSAHGIPVVDYGADELQQEVATAKKWLAPKVARGN